MTASGDENEVGLTDAFSHGEHDEQSSDDPSSAESGRKSAAGHVMHEAVWRGNGGLEVVLMPVLTGFFGWVLDDSIGTRPLFLIIFAVVGFIGSVASQYYRYTAQMAALHQARVAKREAEHDSSTPRFGMVEPMELASYVVPVDAPQSSDDLISEATT